MMPEMQHGRTRGQLLDRIEQLEARLEQAHNWHNAWWDDMSLPERAHQELTDILKAGIKQEQSDYE